MKFESTILGSDSGKKDLTDSAATVNNLKQFKPKIGLLSINYHHLFAMCRMVFEAPTFQ
jgi:hypothetical protein